MILSNQLFMAQWMLPLLITGRNKPTHFRGISDGYQNTGGLDLQKGNGILG